MHNEFVEKFTELIGEEKTNQFFAKWRENHFMQEDVDSLAAWGFNSIRVRCIIIYLPSNSRRTK